MSTKVCSWYFDYLQSRCWDLSGLSFSFLQWWFNINEWSFLMTLGHIPAVALLVKCQCYVCLSSLNHWSRLWWTSHSYWWQIFGRHHPGPSCLSHPPFRCLLSAATHHKLHPSCREVPQDLKKKKHFSSVHIFYLNNGHVVLVFVCSVVLQTDECATECFCLRCPPLKNDSSVAIATGQYLVLWRRYVFTDTHTKKRKTDK